MSGGRLVMYTFVAIGISLPELESYTMSDLRRLFWERNLPVLDVVLNLHDLIHSPRGGQPRLDVPRPTDNDTERICEAAGGVLHKAQGGERQRYACWILRGSQDEDNLCSLVSSTKTWIGSHTRHTCGS